MAYIIISLVLAIIFAAIVFNPKGVAPGNLAGPLVGGIVMFLFWGIINYFALPVLALWNYGLWFELLVTTFIATVIYVAYQDDGYWRFWIPGGVLILMVVIAIGSSAAFHSRAYNERLAVEEVTTNDFSSDINERLAVEEVAIRNFSRDINVIPVEKMVVANSKIARKVVEDRLEEDPGLGSRCLVGNMTMQQITGKFVIDGGKTLDFNEDIVWVAPLEHRSFWKWISNKTTPGYMLVYANDPTRTHLITEINGQKLALRYIKSGCFSDDVERRIRRNGYAKQGLTEFNFEIDSDGRPHWVLCNFKPTIGFGALDTKGCVVLDAQTGEVNSYTITDAPSWIDHIQPAEFVTRQIKWWGEYRHGWWNSWIAQRDVQEPTPGMVLVYSEGQTYWYTGIRSAGGDSATSGFMLINARTKEARYYRVSGVNEQEAERIAEEQGFAKAAEYDATSPVLYNVHGMPTYFMTLTGYSGNVMGYAFVAVTNRQAVGVGSSKKEAESNYLQALKRTSSDTIVDGAVTAIESKTYTVKNITFENGTYYILFNEVKGKEFSGSTEFFRELKWTRSGNHVSVTYSEGISDLIIIDTFDNLDFEF